MPDFSTMTYLIWALVVGYLVIGLILTRNVLRAPSKRMRFWDFGLGAVVMPVLFVFLLLCILFQDLWKRLLLALDFKPPEDMHAGPQDPPEPDPKDLI